MRDHGNHGSRGGARAPLALVLLGLLGLGPVAGGCDNGYPTASCMTCDGRTFSSADCARFAATAGCASSMTETPSAGCSGRCVFTSCTGIPICTGLVPRDGGTPDDTSSP